MKTFYFNTGVRPYEHSPPVKVVPGYKVDGKGVMLIPFDCEDVPEGAVFMYACDNKDLPNMPTNSICRTIYNSKLISKYAYFRTLEV